MSESTAARTAEALLNLTEALGRRMRAGNQRVWLNLDLSVPQLKVLHILVTSGPHSPSALAETLRVSPATVTGLCDGLVERGFAVRESNPTDRRSNRVVATREGQRLVADLGSVHREAWEEILAALSEDEQRLVTQAFRALLRAVERVGRGDDDER